MPERRVSPPLVITPALDNHVPAEVDRRLSSLLTGFVERRGIHHAVFALSSGNGSHRWSAAAGCIDPTDSPAAPPHPDAPFFIASVTKRFIIALVLQAHERGEVDLDAPITDVLPRESTTGLHVRRGVERTSAITARHLASHTAGLPDYFEKRRDGQSLHKQLLAGQDTPWTFEDVIRITREEQRPHFAPQDLASSRQKARYSDTGFQLLIRILEIATGRPFADLLSERITAPLELTRTRLPAHSPPDAATETPLQIYAGRRRLELTSMMESSNDLFSTTADLLTFEAALLRGTLFHNPGTTTLLTERRNRLRNIPVLQYGLGTMFFTVGRLMSAGRSPLTLIGHAGVTGTWLFTCPELDLHLAGTLDQAQGQSLPFRLMAQTVHLWRTSREFPAER